ncbi:hypothetical protein JCM10212_002277 [Sporobolomyces blumeae]
MSSWRGGTRPSTFQSHPPNSQASSTNSTNGTFAPFGQPSSTPSFAGGGPERGRARGRGRGIPRGRGGANLSWKRPTTEPQPSGQDSPGPGQAAPTPTVTGTPGQSAFEAFGNTTSAGNPSNGFGGVAFGSFGAGGPANTFQSAQGASAFGSTATPNGGFGASSNGFASTSTAGSAFAPTTSAFSVPSVFSSQPLFIHPPLSNEEEEEEEGDEEGDDEGDYDDGAELEEQDEQDESGTASPPKPTALTTMKRNPAQISTLEVLGEDSDARRKRFESTLPNNRYLELKPKREAERLRAIKQGLIPDPSKPMRLDQATDFEGTCDEMCPEWEREEREYQNNVDPLERYPGTSRIDPSRAVKAFHRPAAGNDAPLPGDVRPPPILHHTLDYLFHTLLPQHPFAVTHPFVRDRTRSIRQDFTVQNVRGKDAIECNERIARYHILALGILREQSGFSESQELEQLRKVLKSLNEFYDDLRLADPNVDLPNEAEFRSYHLLTHLRDPDIVWSTELLPRPVFARPLLQTALQLHRLAQKSNTARGERASPNAFSRFFKLVESGDVPFLFGCILSTHFNDVRRNALDALKVAFLKQHSAYPVKSLVKVLGCDDEADARSVCEQLGIVVRPDERGKLVAELHKAVVLKTATLKPRVSRRLVEAKLGSTSYQAVIDGGSYSAQPVQPIPLTPSLRAPPPFASSAQPTIRPSFGTSISSFSVPPQASSFVAASVPPTAVPTPTGTPPPFPPVSRSSSAFSKPTLNATAPSFVPSFGPPPPSSIGNGGTSASAVSSAPFSFAAKPSPLSTAPTQQPAAPSFSFAPTAPAFVPSSAPAAPPTLPSTLPLQKPSFFSPAAAEQSAPARKPSSPALASALAPPSQPLPSSPILRRVSAALSQTPPKPAAVAAPPVDRKPLIDALVRSLASGILREAVVGPVRRAGQAALKEQWAVVSEQEDKVKREVGRTVSERVVERTANLLVRECAVQVRREAAIKRDALEAWRSRLVDQKRRRAENERKQAAWQEVVRGLRTTQDRRQTGKADEGEWSEDEVDFMDEEEDAGVAGTADVGLDFGELSLGGNAQAQGTLKREEIDMADRLRKAAETRQRIWARNTFLDIVSSQASTSFQTHRLPYRPTWATLVVTPSTDSAFSTWLTCKFGLDDEGRAEERLTGANLVIQSISYDDEPANQDTEAAGLIVFDCTALPGEELDWEAARTVLQNLLTDVDATSLFRPALIITVCPDRKLEGEATAKLRETIRTKLELAHVTDIVATSDVVVIDLETAEQPFKVSAAASLSSLDVREERVRLPLSAFAKPLLSDWRLSLHNSLRLYQRPETVSLLASSYIRELRDLVDTVNDAAVPSLESPVALPRFPDVDRPFASILSEYIGETAFDEATHFPDVAAAFARRPRPTDGSLARLLLDLLDDFVTYRLCSVSNAGTTTRQVLDERLAPCLRRSQDSLRETVDEIRRAHETAAANDRESDDHEAGAKKKRKASLTTSDFATNRGPKKASVGSGQDRLSALESLMKDAKALLAA